MAEAIDPVSIDMRLAQLLRDDDLLTPASHQAVPGQALAPATLTSAASVPTASSPSTGNAFDDILAKAIESLEGVSKTELYANQMIDKYVKGEVDLQDVMVAQAKMSIMVQLAVTTINSAVNTFKEITQMQV